MPQADPRTLDEAAAWLVRTRDPQFADWDGFTAWLEADPAHNDVYEVLLDTDDVAGGLATPVLPLPVVLPERRRWRWPAAAAVALTAAAAAAILLPRRDFYAVVTGPGEMRQVKLADGTAIVMNGSSRVTLDHKHPRRARLDAGEASFTVVHNGADPFTVESGGTVVEDLGTVFNVVRLTDGTEVAVSEGEVVFDPKGAAVRLTAGHMLFDRDRGVTEIGTAEPAAVGLWRSGRLSYRDGTLTRLADDLSRMIGEPVQVAPALASRRFTGTIMVRGVPHDMMFSRLSAMAGVRAAHGSRGWLLAPDAGASR